jgi:hypothetical protein
MHFLLLIQSIATLLKYLFTPFVNKIVHCILVNVLLKKIIITLSNWMLTVKSVSSNALWYFIYIFLYWRLQPSSVPCILPVLHLVTNSLHLYSPNCTLCNMKLTAASSQTYSRLNSSNDWIRLNKHYFM